MNQGIAIAFDQPWYLLLLVLLPLLVWMSFQSLAGLGRFRRLFALALRCFCFTLLVLALAQAKVERKTDQLTVMYLLDQSDSVSASHRRLMLDYAWRQVKDHRREKDRAGVIVFGAEARIESAPFDGDLPLTGRLESVSQLRSGGTSIESALKMAQASLPEGNAGRVVILTDGNENIGDALPVARQMADDGIGIDVVPVELMAQSDISVDKVDVPADIRRGENFRIRVVITHHSEADADEADAAVTGVLSVTNNVLSENSRDGLLSREVTLVPGKNIFEFDHQLARSAMYTLTAQFEPDDAKADLINENNVASAFAHVGGKGKVLLIEDASHFGDSSEFNYLVSQLSLNEIEVERRSSSRLYDSAADLLQFDSVILANVARATGEGEGDAGGEVSSFSDDQIRMLVDNCEHFGCGIVMLGGDRSFGAGGWSNSLLEKAMPVDFQIKNDKVAAVGALAMMMHACELPQGNHWQIKIAEEAIKVLGPMDYCGVIDWANSNGQPRWLWQFDRKNGGIDRVFNNRKKMLGLVSRMNSGDMMDFNAPMRTMLAGFNKVDAAMKHAIIISDGDPTPPTNALLNQFVKNKIKISTCAIGTHGPPGSTPLQKISRVTGGKYYVIKNASALPRIYQREARRVAKPVIFESKQGISVVPSSGANGHEMLQGIDLAGLPRFVGYVMTTIKTSGLVERLAIASSPNKAGTEQNRTLLATWRYGNGRTVCFTSDAGYRWLSQWQNTSAYDKLFTQMIRYSMRPVTEDATFSVASEVRDGKAIVTVNALDEDENFLNFLDMVGTGINGDETLDLEFRQVGPGRYVATREVNQQGDWLFTIFPGKGYQRVMTGVSIPWSREYEQRQSNLALLRQLTRLEPRGGDAGSLSEVSLTSDGMTKLREMNSFRPGLSSTIRISDIWPLLVLLCGVVFLGDVFIRRVAVTFEWVGAAWQWFVARVLGKETQRTPESLSRLQSRKAEIEKEIESRRATVRFEPEANDDVDADRRSGADRLKDVLAEEIEKTPAPLPPPSNQKLSADEDNSYTSRLLDAKRKAQQKNRRSGDG